MVDVRGLMVNPNLAERRDALSAAVECRLSAAA
jgi:hypothetical protein